MKQWLLIFFAGLALGTAIGWLAGGSGAFRSDPSASAGGNGTGSHGASIPDRPDSARSGGSLRPRGGKSALRDPSRDSPGTRGGFVEYLQGMRGVDDMATIAMSTWVEANPEQAIAWFREQSSGAGDERFQELLQDDEVQTAFFAGLARVDADKARDMVVNFDDEGSRESAAKRVFRDAWSGESRALPDAALEAAQAAGFGEQVEPWIGEVQNDPRR